MSKLMLTLVAVWGFMLSVIATDYFFFRNAGGRFTSDYGVELCESHRRLAEHTGYEGPLPTCDYPTRVAQ